ncbi:MAG TPA: hypothetical protein VN549_00395 [Negativicutes bacterium]|nr:hypothetical protein [Negativicutes bacterium]
MSLVVLDALEGSNGISDRIREKLLEDKGSVYFRLEDMNIQQCRSCGACGFKSPGRCVAKDASHEVLEAIAKSPVFVLLTPVRFGGYNSILKKAVDKFMNLSLPAYTVKQGHLLHPTRYGSKHMVVIGMYEGSAGEQEESFRKLVEHNAFNLEASCETHIFSPADGTGAVEREIRRLLGGVC